jgi:hypothetical protein
MMNGNRLSLKHPHVEWSDMQMLTGRENLVGQYSAGLSVSKADCAASTVDAVSLLLAFAAAEGATSHFEWYLYDVRGICICHGKGRNDA